MWNFRTWVFSYHHWQEAFLQLLWKFLVSIKWKNINRSLFREFLRFGAWHLMLSITVVLNKHICTFSSFISILYQVIYFYVLSMHGSTHTQWIWEIRGQLPRAIPSFHINSKDQAQIAPPGSRCMYLLSYLNSPAFFLCLESLWLYVQNKNMSLWYKYILGC